MLRRCRLSFILGFGIAAFGFLPIGCTTRNGTPTVFPAEPFDAEGDAKILEHAIEIYDFHAIRNVLTKRVSSQRQEITKAYQNLYGGNLVDKVTIGGEVGDIIIALLTPRSDLYAKALFDAVFGLGNSQILDMVEILCTISDSEVKATELSYENLFGKTLKDTLQSSVQGTIYAACAANRNEDQPVDGEKACSDARRLAEASREETSGDKGPLTNFLETSSYQQFLPTFRHYVDITGQTFEDAIQRELSNRYHYDRFLIVNIVKYIKSSDNLFARRLFVSMDGPGTDETALYRIIITRSDVDLGDIKEAFERLYKAGSLEELVADDTSGDERDFLMDLVSGNRM